MIQSTTFVYIAHSLTPSQIPMQDNGLPMQICSDCYTKCEQWDTFKRLCIEVDEYLKKNITLQPKTERVSDAGNIEELNGTKDPVVIAGDIKTQPVVLLERLTNDDIARATVNSQTHDTDWWCPICSLMIPESIHLRDHLKEHYSEKVHKYNNCNH